MDESFDTQKLLVLRKLTRAISELLRGQMRDYLTTLAPLTRPRTVLGDYVQGSMKEVGKNPDQSFKELQATYEKIATAPLYRLPPELKPPVEIISTALEMMPLEYKHVAKTESGETKIVNITSPLRWVINYSGFNPGRLREMLSRRDRDGEKVRQHVLHNLVMHVVLSKQPGVMKIMQDLQFPIATEHPADLGGLPVTLVSSSVSTVRPPDRVIIESTEISGMDVFEEVVNLGDISRMQNPLKERLIELARSHGADPLAE